MSSADTQTIPSFNARSPRDLLAYGFGAGLSPWAPGTVGTLLAVPLYALLSVLPTMLYVLIVAALIVAAIWACGAAAREIGEDDPSAVVGDEIVGFLVAMIAAPSGLIWIITGFLLFRLLDITKPWPISAVQRMRGGAGIVLDDVVAGAITWFVLLGLHEMVEASLRGAAHAMH
jgi:phosphatidylglycerophosphatase A